MSRFQTQEQKDFAFQVRHRMAQSGWTRAEMARRMNTHPHSVHIVLNGSASPNLKTMVRMAEALGCRLNIIITRVLEDER